METKIIRTPTKNKTNFINNLLEKSNTNAISKLQYLKVLANKFKPRRLKYNKLKFLFLSFILS